MTNLTSLVGILSFSLFLVRQGHTQDFEPFIGIRASGEAQAMTQRFQAKTNAPAGMAVLENGTFYFADELNSCIRLSKEGKVFSLRLDSENRIFPFQLALGKSSEIYFTDRVNNKIFVLTPDGVTKTIAGTGSRGYSKEGTLAINADLCSPMGIAISPDGLVYFCEVGSSSIRFIDKKGQLQTFDTQESELISPVSLAFSKTDSDLFVCDNRSARIKHFNEKGNLIAEIGADSNCPNLEESQKQPKLESPVQVIMSNDGILYIGTSGKIASIFKIDPTTTEWSCIASHQTNDYAFVTGLGTNDSGEIYVSIQNENIIYRNSSQSHQASPINKNNLVFTLSPNPTPDQFIIAFQKPIQVKTEVSIFDSQSRLIKSLNVPTGQQFCPITLEHACSGTYIVQARNSNGSYSQKLIVQSNN
jgi:sugar lactone lactonase YvrE